MNSTTGRGKLALVRGGRTGDRTEIQEGSHLSIATGVEAGTIMDGSGGMTGQSGDLLKEVLTCPGVEADRMTIGDLETVAETAGDGIMEGKIAAEARRGGRSRRGRRRGTDGRKAMTIDHILVRADLRGAY